MILILVKLNTADKMAKVTEEIEKMKEQQVKKFKIVIMDG